jgi:hypothetical protein
MLVLLEAMPPPLGATIAVVVFPAVSRDVLLLLEAMPPPLGATIAVVLFVVVVALAPTAVGLSVVVIAFCGKQADCVTPVVVAFVPLAAGPNDAPPGAGVAAVSLPPSPVACTELIGATINVSIRNRAGKAIIVINLR